MWAPFWGVNGGFRRCGWWQLTTRSGNSERQLLSSASARRVRAVTKANGGFLAWRRCEQRARTRPPLRQTPATAIHPLLPFAMSALRLGAALAAPVFEALARPEGGPQRPG